MAKWWKQIDWRCIQMNLREIDMLDIDKEQIINDLKSFDATVFMINTGGIIASYPTKLPFHHQSEYLKGDSLRSIIDACQKEGIRVIARMDFSKIREDIFNDHPEWAFRTEDGEVINYNGNITTCLNGGYQQNAIFDILNEVIDKLHVDGFYFNMPGMRVFDYHQRYYGFCHCDSCKRKFKDMYDEDIPYIPNIDFPVDIHDPKLKNNKTLRSDPKILKYMHFQQTMETRLVDKLRSFIHEKDPDVAVMDVDYIRSESNIDFEGSLPRFPYSASSNTRFNLGTDQSIVSSNTSVDFFGFPYRHISVTPSLQKLRLWENIINFGGLDYYLIGRVDNHKDRSAFKSIRNVFNFHKKHADTYRNLKSTAKTLVIHSGMHRAASDEEKGWISALTHTHIPMAEASSDVLIERTIDHYDHIITSGRLRPKQISSLKQYVSNGGTLILSGALSPSEEIDELIGIKKREKRYTDMRSSMFILSEDDKLTFKSLADTDVVLFGRTYEKNQYENHAKTWMNLTLPQRFGPPEMCYGAGEDDHYPGVIMNRHNKGRVIYIPSSLGALYHQAGLDNTYRFLKDILTNVAGMNSLAKNLTEMAEVTLGVNHDKHIMVAQILNLSGFTGTKVFKPLPITAAKLNIPITSEITGVSRLTDGKACSFKHQEGIATINVGPVNEYEGIVIKHK